jgi:hypothetical protein
VLERSRLGDFVPEVLNLATPEATNLHLVRACDGAVYDAERLYFIEGICIGCARQRGWWAGSKLVRVLEGECGHLRPLKVLWLLRKVWRCGLIISRPGPEDIWGGHGGRSIVTPQGQETIGDTLPETDASGLVTAIRNLCQGLLKLGVQHRLEARV